MSILWQVSVVVDFILTMFSSYEARNVRNIKICSLVKIGKPYPIIKGVREFGEMLN